MFKVVKVCVHSMVQKGKYGINPAMTIRGWGGGLGNMLVIKEVLCSP